MNIKSNQLALVILNWNGKSLLEKFLPSVVQHSDEANLYVIDNASSDNSIHWLQQQYPEITIIQLSENLGYAGGYQQGLKCVEEPYYCLLNSDVEVTENWLQPILDLSGAGGGLIDNLGYPYCRGRVFDTLEKDRGQYNDTTAVFWASGACFFIRKTDFWEVGGLDTDYFAHQEEIDLCWRLHNYSKKVMYCGKTTVYHVGGASLNYVSPKKTFLNFRNSLYSILKNRKGATAYGVLFIRMVLDGVAGIQFLLQGKFLHFTAILKAHFSFYSNLSATLKKRKSVPKKETHYNTKSIVMDYFVFKKYK